MGCKAPPVGRVVSPHQRSFHSPRVSPIEHGKLVQTLVAHPLSLSHTHNSVLTPSFPSPPCPILLSTAGRSTQSSKVEWNMVWVSSPQTLQKANRSSFVRNSVFQLKKQLKTCCVKGFIKRVLIIHLFKASWPLHAAAQADLLPWSSTVPCAAVRPRTWTRALKTLIHELIHPRIM